jgi:PleD family two-component response regulator
VTACDKGGVTTPHVLPTVDSARPCADRIVVVDDDAMMVELMTELLARAGIADVHGVTDSREALRVIRDVDADLVILDLLMPHVDGFEILGGLRDGEATTGFRPVLVMTGDDTPATRQRALALDATDVLVKPVPMRQTIHHVLDLLRARHAAQHDTRAADPKPRGTVPTRHWPDGATAASG